MRARLVVSRAEHPSFNMALDEAVRADRPTLRLYGFSPAGLSLGYFQSAADFPPAWLAERGLVLVRRITGGAAICHQGDLTFSFVARPDHPVFVGTTIESYERIHSAIALGLAQLGIACGTRGDSIVRSDSARAKDPICFHTATRFDLVAAGRKLVGSAQRRTRERVLHHGSIPLAKNPLAPEAACALDLVGRPVGFDELAPHVSKAFSEAFELDLEEGEIERDERLLAERLVASRYGAESWNRRR